MTDVETGKKESLRVSERVSEQGMAVQVNSSDLNSFHFNYSRSAASLRIGPKIQEIRSAS